MILARFQMSGTTAATGLSFQAAVPKVSLFFDFCCIFHVLFRDSIVPLVTTTTNASYVESEYQPWISGDAADEGDCTCGSE